MAKYRQMFPPTLQKLLYVKEENGIFLQNVSNITTRQYCGRLTVVINMWNNNNDNAWTSLLEHFIQDTILKLITGHWVSNKLIALYHCSLSNSVVFLPLIALLMREVPTSLPPPHGERVSVEIAIGKMDVSTRTRSAKRSRWWSGGSSKGGSQRQIWPDLLREASETNLAGFCKVCYWPWK
jgi:hypothetical protein